MQPVSKRSVPASGSRRQQDQIVFLMHGPPSGRRHSIRNRPTRRCGFHGRSCGGACHSDGWSRDSTYLLPGCGSRHEVASNAELPTWRHRDRSRSEVAGALPVDKPPNGLRWILHQIAGAAVVHRGRASGIRHSHAKGLVRVPVGVTGRLSHERHVAPWTGTISMDGSTGAKVVDSRHSCSERDHYTYGFMRSKAISVQLGKRDRERWQAATLDRSALPGNPSPPPHVVARDQARHLEERSDF